MPSGRGFPLHRERQRAACVLPRASSFSGSDGSALALALAEGHRNTARLEAKAKPVLTFHGAAPAPAGRRLRARSSCAADALVEGWCLGDAPRQPTPVTATRGSATARPSALCPLLLLLGKERGLPSDQVG